MAKFVVRPARLDPYKTYKFRVLWDGRYVAGISKVTMLKRTTEQVKHRDGGEKNRKILGRTEFDAITLERGVTHDAAFAEWASHGSKSLKLSGTKAFPTDIHKDVTIEMYNEAGQKAVVYRVYRCWISELQAIPDLDANANAMAIQLLKLENEGWERDTDVKEPTEPSPS
jgi:phage tail-like protein